MTKSDLNDVMTGGTGKQVYVAPERFNNDEFKTAVVRKNIACCV